VHRLREGRARGSTLNARGTGVAASVAVAVILADQFSKAWVLDHVTPGSHHLFGPFGVQLGRNHGVAFSLLSGHSAVAGVAAFVLTCVVAVCATRSVPVVSSVVFGLLLGGGVSNLADRVARRGSGGVVDFITLSHWPTFNVADAAITCGVVGLVVLLAVHRPLFVTRTTR
jgi:signal peptidase II